MLGLATVFAPSLCRFSWRDLNPLHIVKNHSIDAIILSRALTLVAFSVNSVEGYELLLGATLSNPNQQDKVNHYII